MSVTFVQILWALAAIGFSIAAVITAYYRGKAHLLRAQRGDPELPNLRSAWQMLLLLRAATRLVKPSRRFARE